MDTIFIIGRIMFGSFFIIMGLMHMMKMNMLTGYAASKKVPMPKLAVMVSGLLILLGGIGVATDLFLSISVVLLAIFLVGVSLGMHRFWKEPEELSNFLKNMALLGAALMLF